MLLLNNKTKLITILKFPAQLFVKTITSALHLDVQWPATACI